jgi:hypothetical protein
LNIAIGVKDKSVKLGTIDNYRKQVKWFDKKRFLFYDVRERRAWLVDGSSTLLHFVRAILAEEAADGIDAILAREAGVNDLNSGLKEAPQDLGGRAAAKYILRQDQNRDMKLFENYAKFTDEVMIDENGIEIEQRKSKKEIFYYRLSDVVDELYRKIELIQAHLADKEDKDGIGAKIRLSMRRNLEGFDFCDIAYENGPIRAKATTLQSSGKGWVDMARAIDSITIFGTGFGELLLPSEDATLCAPWKTLPQNKDYLAASMQVINDLRSKQETPLEGEPLQLADGIYWHTPDQCFAACHCTGKQTCDRVQVLHPTPSWAWEFPGAHRLASHGASSWCVCVQRERRRCPDPGPRQSVVSVAG